MKKLDQIHTSMAKNYYLGNNMQLTFDFSITDIYNQFTVLHFACSCPSLNMICDVGRLKQVNSFALCKNFRTPQYYVPQQFLSSKKMIRKYERKDLVDFWSKSSSKKDKTVFTGIGAEE